MISSSSSSNSSSSSLSSSSSSSSTNYMNHYEHFTCSGYACEFFSLWAFTCDSQEDLTLYAVFEPTYQGQKVKIYRDEPCTDLVSVGTSNESPIFLSEVNGSGFNGRVNWDKTLIDYSSVVLSYIGTNSSSSSSSSSTSSVSSASSLSSTSSSSSSLNNHDTSSVSSSSTSSSSSYNLRHTSSSSSSVNNWEQMKPAKLADAGIYTISSQNSLSQIIKVYDSTYTIGDVYCYLYRRVGNSVYNITLDVYACDSDLRPYGPPIGSAFISSSSVTEDKWYAFHFTIPSTTTPPSQYIAFVMRNYSGDESNYVLWGYSYNDKFPENKAYISNDNISWVEQENTLRAINIGSTFNPYDLGNKQIISQEATAKIEIGYLNSPNPEFFNTRIVNKQIGSESSISESSSSESSSSESISTSSSSDSTSSSNDVVEIDYKKQVFSFIVDASGSMGYNDKFNNRVTLIQDMIQKLKDKYKSNVLFDIIKFGGTDVTVNPTVDIGNKISYINVNLFKANQKPYSFNISSGSASQGDIYENNSVQYAVIQSIYGGSTLWCYGSYDPETYGMLNKVSGNGDAVIYFNSFSYDDVSTLQFACYGFKNLQDSHEYNIVNFSLDNIDVDEVSLTNAHAFSPASESPTLAIGQNGPGEITSMDLVATNNVILSKFFGTVQLNYAKVTDKIYAGSNIITVDDVSNFIVGDYIDITNGNYSFFKNKITEINGLKITLTNTVPYDIDKFTDSGCIASISNYTNYIYVNGATANLLVRDVSENKNIVFFLQDKNGFTWEWDITPYNKWEYANYFWLDESAILPIVAYDSDGDPLPDGTMVEFTTTQPNILNNAIPNVTVTKDATIYSTKICLSSTEMFSIGDIIDINNGLSSIQTTTITAKGYDIEDFILIKDPLSFALLLTNKPKIYKNDKSNAQKTLINTSNLLSCNLSTVDITPLYANKEQTVLESYDIDRVPLGATYDDFNTEPYRKYIQKQIVDSPTVQGSAAIRILPITEDVLKTLYEKNQDDNQVLSLGPNPQYTSQTQQNSNDSIAVSQVLNVTETGVDYSLKTPSYLYGGQAEGLMTVFPSVVENITVYNINASGVDSHDLLTMGKKYTVYPSITINDTIDNIPIAKQYLKPIDCTFVSPINIYNEESTQKVEYIVERPCEEGSCAPFCGYVTVHADGVYADSGDYTITYNVSNKLNAIENGNLNIKIYSNKIIDLNSFASIRSGQNSYSRYLNLQGKDSSINQWRTYVNNNPISGITNPTNQVTSDNAYQSILSMADSVSQIGAYTSLLSGYGEVPNSSNVQQTENYDFYSHPEQWALAKQFQAYEFTIPIVNGIATLTIPSSKDIALLMVEAYMTFGTEYVYESILTNYIAIANPITVGGLTPYYFIPEENEKYEVGINVYWKMGMGDIIDDAIVNFYFASTKAEPIASMSVDGWAGGVIVGPHTPLIFPPIDLTKDPLICQNIPIVENVTVEVFHPSSGYSMKVQRRIMWDGKSAEVSSGSNRFIFHVNAYGDNMWSDGSNSDINITASLEDSDTIDWIGEVNPNGVDLLRKNNKSVWGGNTSINSMGWTNPNGVSFSPKILNKNVGFRQNEPIGVLSHPWEQTITLSTSFSDVINDKQITFYGSGQLIYDPSEKSAPVIFYNEPLSISAYMEGSFNRNGKDSPYIVADVAWKDSYINPADYLSYFSQYGYPDVSFDAGVADIENLIDGSVKKYKDTRNNIDGCYSIKVPYGVENIKLTTNSSKVGLFRTSIYVDGLDSHTHSCNITGNGTFYTTDTIVLSGSVVSHTHEITNYVVLTENAHSHTLRSVAITKLLPTINSLTDYAINATVIYDPTNCEPYNGEVAKPYKNRKMFSTLRINAGSVPGPKLQITILTGKHLSPGGDFNENQSPNPTFYTAKSPSETDMGFDVAAIVEYVDGEISSSSSESMSYSSSSISGTSSSSSSSSSSGSGSIPDGTRVIFEILSYKPTSNSQNGEYSSSKVNTSVSGEIKEYMTLTVKASAYYMGLFAATTKEICIASSNQWVPQIKRMVPELTNDAYDLSDALNKIGSYGPSPINDGILFAAKLLKEDELDLKIKSTNKNIFVLTDGDENCSESSINKSIANINFLSNANMSSVKVGDINGFDNAKLQLLANNCNGSIYELKNYDGATISSVIDKIFTSQSLQFNYGIYRNTFEFPSDRLMKSIGIPNVTVVNNQKMYFRTRVSNDKEIWTSWTAWSIYSNGILFPEDLKYLCKYCQYEVKFMGNSDLESPTLDSGAEIEFFEPQEFVMFFNPINIDMSNNEYVSSINIAYKADIPSTSTLGFELCVGNSPNVLDYATLRDGTNIIPSRHKEITFTSDYRTYVALNGKWSSDLIAIVEKINSNGNRYPIEPNKYILDPQGGKITFMTQQSPSDKIFITVQHVPFFRILARIRNYSDETITIHNVSLIYNVTKNPEGV